MTRDEAAAKARELAKAHVIHLRSAQEHATRAISSALLAAYARGVEDSEKVARRDRSEIGDAIADKIRALAPKDAKGGVT